MYTSFNICDELENCIQIQVAIEKQHLQYPS